jgi:peptide/nickel transport system substrate-binding protein
MRSVLLASNPATEIRGDRQVVVVPFESYRVRLSPVEERGCEPRPPSRVKLGNARNADVCVDVFCGVRGAGLSDGQSRPREWHDGRPFTADDVVFNWEYASDPTTAAVTIGNYRDAKVEKIDPLTVRVRFERPTSFWAGLFVAGGGMIIPKHLFEPYKGANSRDAPANPKPVGTGPYRFVELKPGDLVRGERNPAYHVADRPYFDTIEMKGDGDAVSAARAVIQSGEYDYAWNMQVEDEILLKLENAGNAKGRAEIVRSRAMEHIQLNSADPWTEVDGERANPKTMFSDPAVGQALRLLVDPYCSRA